jgi:hypothetical protein
MNAIRKLPGIGTGSTARVILVSSIYAVTLLCVAGAVIGGLSGAFDDDEPETVAVESSATPEPTATETANDQYSLWVDDVLRELNISITTFRGLAAEPVFDDDEWRDQVLFELTVWRRWNDEAESATPPDEHTITHNLILSGTYELIEATATIESALESNNADTLANTRSQVDAGHELLTEARDSLD